MITYSLALASLVFMLSYVPVRLSEKSRMIFLLFFTKSKSPLSVFVFYNLCGLHVVSPTTCSFLKPPLFLFLRHHVFQPLPSSLIVPLSLPQPLLGGFNGRHRDWMCYQFPVGKGTLRRRQWHPTPVLLPGKSHGWRSLEGCSPWGRWGSDTTERLHFHFSLSCSGEGNGNPLQCSCLENPRDSGAWWAAVYGVAQSRTRLKRLSSSSSSSSKGTFNGSFAWSHKCQHWMRLGLA